MFTTPSGQTGKDAYVFELAAINNARRALDLRMSLLMDNMMMELPESARYEMRIPSSMFPDAKVTAKIDTIRKQLNMSRIASQDNCEFVAEMLSSLMLY